MDGRQSTDLDWADPGVCVCVCGGGGGVIYTRIMSIKV